MSEPQPPFDIGRFYVENYPTAWDYMKHPASLALYAMTIALLVYGVLEFGWFTS